LATLGGGWNVSALDKRRTEQHKSISVIE
jgi:hypothetical protein